MTHRAISVEELRDLINKGQAQDPLIFLESIMNGQDPRKLSGIYKLVCDIDDFSGSEPSRDDWYEIVEYVTSHLKYHHVSVGDSMSAAKTLSEYLHAKRKQVEVTGGAGQVADPAQHPLSEEEIELFKEKFNAEF